MINLIQASQAYRCDKHGELQYAARFDHRSFCPRCIADFFQKEIGTITVSQKAADQ